MPDTVAKEQDNNIYEQPSENNMHNVTSIAAKTTRTTIPHKQQPLHDQQQ